MNFFSVFSGIGLFDLGLEKAGWQCVGQCEIEPFPIAVLEHHWPDVWRFEDVKRLTGELIRERCGHVDAIVGGPPCQPASVAGQRKGSADHRWLWSDFLRLVREVGPVWVLAENPSGVLSIDVEGVRFSEWLTSQFKDLGYSLLTVLLSAEDIGAPHERERVWFMAHSNRQRKQQSVREVGEKRRRSCDCRQEILADSDQGLFEQKRTEAKEEGRWLGNVGDAVENPDSRRLQCSRFGAQRQRRTETIGAGSEVGNSPGMGLDGLPEISGSSCSCQKERRLRQFTRTSYPMGQGFSQHEWEAPRLIESQSALGAATDGSDKRLAGYWHREAVKAVGNAVVPQIPEILARTIDLFEQRRMA